MASTSIAQTINRMKLGGSDKVALTGLFNGLVADLALVRAQNAALLAKLDANHGAASDHAATLGIAAGAISITK